MEKSSPNKAVLAVLFIFGTVSGWTAYTLLLPLFCN